MLLGGLKAKQNEEREWREYINFARNHGDGMDNSDRQEVSKLPSSCPKTSLLSPEKLWSIMTLRVARDSIEFSVVTHTCHPIADQTVGRIVASVGTLSRLFAIGEPKKRERKHSGAWSARWRHEKVAGKMLFNVTRGASPLPGPKPNKFAVKQSNETSPCKADKVEWEECEEFYVLLELWVSRRFLFCCQ